MHATIRTLSALLLALTATFTAAADKYPARMMEMMVPWGPGGGADGIGRLVARWLESDLKITMPVVNMPGAGGAIGLGKLVHAPADGHNLGVLTSDTVLFATLEPGKLKMADLTPLAVLTRQPSGLFVRSDSRFKTWADVIAESRTKPISVATTGPNSPDDLAVAHLDSKGVRMLAVAYSKPGERYSAVLGGHVDLLFEQAGDIKGHLDGKTLRPLMFFSPQRLSAPFSDVPVSAEYGYESVPAQVRAIVVRSGTDAEALAALSKSLAKFAASTGYTDYLREQLAAPDSYVPLARASAFIARDIDALKTMTANLPAVPQAAAK